MKSWHVLGHQLIRHIVTEFDLELAHGLAPRDLLWGSEGPGTTTLAFNDCPRNTCIRLQVRVRGENVQDKEADGYQEHRLSHHMTPSKSL
jgi:hypothetical protein